MPVIVLRHLTENQKRAFMLADNKLALNAGWDSEMLRLELEALAAQDFPTELTGFDEQELKELLEQMTEKTLRDSDDVPEPSSQVGSMLSDLWILGDHRLLCGDGTCAADLARVLDGQSCDLVFTDLPYNVNYVGKTGTKMKLANDNLGSRFGEFLEAACRAILGVSQGAIYICMSSGELHSLFAAFTEAGGHWSTYVIWAKSSFTLTEPSQLGRCEARMYFVFNKGTAKVSTTF